MFLGKGPGFIKECFDLREGLLVFGDGGEDGLELRFIFEGMDEKCCQTIICIELVNGNQLGREKRKEDLLTWLNACAICRWVELRRASFASLSTLTMEVSVGIRVKELLESKELKGEWPLLLRKPEELF